MKTHLILGEFGNVGQYHVLHLRWAVSCSQSQAPQGVRTCPVITDHRHDLLFDAFGEGNFAVSHSDMGASLNNSLWGPLQEVEQICQILTVEQRTDMASKAKLR